MEKDKDESLLEYAVKQDYELEVQSVIILKSTVEGALGSRENGKNNIYDNKANRFLFIKNLLKSYRET